MKEKVDLTTYREQPMDIEKARLFLHNFKHFEALFSEEVLTKCLSKFEVRDFTNFEDIPIERSQYYEDKYPRYSECHTSSFPVYLYKNGIEYEGRENKSAYSYIVPSNYPKEKELLKTCIFEVIPELEKLQWNIYHLDREDNNIYLKTTVNNSLYCPVNALLNFDKEAIIQRHTDYHKKYYHGTDRKKYLDIALSVFDTVPVDILFYILDCYKEGKKPDFVSKYSPQGKKYLDKIAQEKLHKKNKEFVKYHLKDTIQNVLERKFTIDYSIDENNEEWVTVTINDKPIKTNITGLEPKDITRHVLFDIE